MTRQKAAIFLDRDGTLIEDVGVLACPEDIRLYPYAVDALRLLQEKYLLFVVTNQPGIAEGLVSSSQVAKVNDSLHRMLFSEGVSITNWYVCPHARRDNCCCIKPNPTFLLQAAEEYDIDLRHSFMIGDHPHDVTTGDKVGTFGLYLLSGHGQKHVDELPSERLVFHTLLDGARWIIEHSNHATDLEESIAKGAVTIREGGLVAFPTETVYGLGANAMDGKAVAKIFEAKKRPLYDPLIVHIADVGQLDTLVRFVPESAIPLMEAYWPGPLTLVFPKSELVPDVVTSGGSTVAVRMPATPIALNLIRQSGCAIAAPSANLFGRTSPTTAMHVKEQLDGCYDVLIDGGACRVGIESTVLSLAEDRPVLLRAGVVSRENLETVIGPILFGMDCDKGGVGSPGMMPSHYAPRTPLIITEDVAHYAPRTDVGIILFQHPVEQFHGSVFRLCQNGDLREAATNLYRGIRILDSMGLSLLVAQPAPDSGIGVALNDRLYRASNQSGLTYEEKAMQ